ncbi:MAG TPA: HD domain-containing phosphohydrolase [Polyangiaceae bacterium]|nr:HD domain-containing phosphohydrolase [Polyangiaceae bacterium]
MVADLSLTNQRTTPVLIVDDDPSARRAACRVLKKAGYDVRQAASVSEARRALSGGGIGVVVLDVVLPDASGLELLRCLKHEQADVDVLVCTGWPAKWDMEEAIRLGATSYLRKPLDPFVLEGQVAAAQHSHETKCRARERSTALEASLRDTKAMLDRVPRRLAQQLARAWDLRHVETGAHVRRIGAYSEALGLNLGLASDDAETLGQVAMLHDIGKIAIPDAILTKPGPLAPEEFAIMKLHPRAGADMLDGAGHPFLERAAQVALRHHERWDGSGYPGGLRGDATPYDARIVAVADVYDALGQARCYKRGWSEEEIERYFVESSGRLFERPIVEALLDSRPRLREIAQSFPELPLDRELSSAVMKVG